MAEPLLPDNPLTQGSLPRSALSHPDSFLSYCLSVSTVSSELNFYSNYRSFTVAALNLIYRGRRKHSLRLHPTAQVRGLNRKRNPFLVGEGRYLDSRSFDFAQDRFRGNDNWWGKPHPTKLDSRSFAGMTTSSCRRRLNKNPAIIPIT